MPSVRRSIDVSNSNFHARSHPRSFPAVASHAFPDTPCACTDPCARYPSGTRRVRKLCSKKEPHRKVARLCLQTVKRWTRGGRRGRRVRAEGWKSPSGSMAYALADGISFILPCLVDAPRRKPFPLSASSSDGSFELPSTSGVRCSTL